MPINEICENSFVHAIRNSVSLMALIEFFCPTITGNEVAPTAGGMCLINHRNQTKILHEFQKVTYPRLFFHFGFTGTSFSFTVDSRTARAANIEKSMKVSESTGILREQEGIRSGTLFNTALLIHTRCHLCCKYFLSCGRIQFVALDIK